MMTTIPKIPSRQLPVSYNPARRLYAAVVVQACRDLFLASLNDQDRDSAHTFLTREADFIALEFGLRVDRITALCQSSEVPYAA